MAHSDEFRFMISQLPVSQDSSAYIYLSDSFLRRLTGPRVKIGQARRVKKRAAMEVITAAAMLAYADGFGRVTDLTKLKSLGYLPEKLDISDFSIGADGIVHSQSYGTLNNLVTLL